MPGARAFQPMLRLCWLCRRSGLGAMLPASKSRTGMWSGENDDWLVRELTLKPPTLATFRCLSIRGPERDGESGQDKVSEGQRERKEYMECLRHSCYRESVPSCSVAQVPSAQRLPKRSRPKGPRCSLQAARPPAS